MFTCTSEVRQSLTCTLPGYLAVRVGGGGHFKDLILEIKVLFMI